MKTKAKNLISQKSHLAARSIFWLYFFPFVIFGQEPVSRIEKLNIGHIHSALSISGTNLSNSNWGRLANDRYFPFFNVFENPAFLFGERLPKIIFIISPAVRYGITEIAGLSSYINPEIDANIDRKSVV